MDALGGDGWKVDVFLFLHLERNSVVARSRKQKRKKETSERFQKDFKKRNVKNNPKNTKTNKQKQTKKTIHKQIFSKTFRLHIVDLWAFGMPRSDDRDPRLGRVRRSYNPKQQLGAMDRGVFFVFHFV